MTRTVLILVALAVAMSLSALTWRLRRAHKDVATVLEGEQRYVDMGVRLNVVVQDDNGIEYLRGKPKLRIVETLNIGGIVDTSASPAALVGSSTNPVDWYTSALSLPLIMHEDEMPLSICVEGGMGAGKTTDMCQWIYVRAMALTGMGAEIGATAPTTERLKMTKDAILDMFPESWRRWKERDSTFTLANGVTIKLVSTHQSSSKEGSRIQGYNWSACASDELQDSLDEDANIRARGRDAPDGKFRRFVTCTVKDHPEYRSWKGAALTAVNKATERPIWKFQRKGVLDSPFYSRAFYDEQKGGMSARDFALKFDAQDLAPEGVVYHGWKRTENLRPVPRVGRVMDVTNAELKRFGLLDGDVLVGHDPGRIQDVSIILKAYCVTDPKTGITPRDPDWYVIGEVTTEQQTTEAHVYALTKWLSEHGYRRPLVRIDPYSINSGADNDRPDVTHLRIFQNHGYVIKPAAYKPNSTDPGQIKPEARIDLLNTLFCSADGKRRLFVACDDRQQPVAPKLVDSLESMVRGPDGKAESGPKNRTDKSHWPCALSYAVYAIEKPRLESIRRNA